MRLWLVGQVRHGAAWEVQGVFSAEEKAVEACRTPFYFVMPLELDADVPGFTFENAGAYYPLQVES